MSRTRPHLIAALCAVLGAAAAAAGCSAPAAEPGPEAGASAVSGPPTGTSHEGHDDHEDGVGTAPSAPPTHTGLIAAQTYVRMWARASLDRDRWYAGVHGWATPAYGRLLADTDPIQVPARVVTGVPRPVSSTTAVLVADVPTDAGPIRVTVVDTDGRWLIASAHPAR